MFQYVNRFAGACLLVALLFESIVRAESHGGMHLAAYVHLSQCFNPDDPVAKREADLVSMVELAHKAGFQTLVPYISTTSGRTLYPSQINPHHEYGDWDAMACVMKAARAINMRVVPTIPTLVSGHDRPTGILADHLDWALLGEDGQPLGTISPGHPDARTWVLNWVAEICDRYQPDGLLLDYMRYPNKPSQFDPTTAKRYEQWRAEQVGLEQRKAEQQFRELILTEFMEEISNQSRSRFPGLELSIYSWGFHVTRDHRVAQPWPNWVAKGLVDEVNISGYWYPDTYPKNWGSNHLDVFRKTLRESQQLIDQAGNKARLTFALGVKTSHGQLSSVGEIAEYLTIAQEMKVAGTTFFTWSYLEPFLPELNETGILSAAAKGEPIKRNQQSNKAITRDEASTSPISQNTPQSDDNPGALRFRLSVDRGKDLGQCFGSLFEVTSDDGKITIGAGFQNAYNTRLRADRHSLHFFVRDNAVPQDLSVTKVSRPNELCGTYLHSIDDQLISTYGGHRKWNETSSTWQTVPDVGGTGESMRVGTGMLQFGDSCVQYNGRAILDRPDRGDYQMFFYANSYICFYHVVRGDKGYRAYSSDRDGFSRLVACPWSPSEARVDLSKAIVQNLPVVGETTFAWGVLGDQIVTGSNIGGFYKLANGTWSMLREPDIKTSFQLYSSLAYHDRLLMGQYPTGRLFAYDGQQLSELADWPPIPDGFSRQAREAQTTAIYGGEVLVGIWPWGELWRLAPSSQRWSLAQRMFDHPKPAPELVHPYDVENRHNAVPNLWGQRITSLIPLRDELWLSTSAKAPVAWDAEMYPFLSPDLWQSYGQVYRLSAPGNLSAPTDWTNGPTIFDLTITPQGMSIDQDGVRIGWQRLDSEVASRWCQQKFTQIQWGQGIYGRGAVKLKPLIHP